MPRQAGLITPPQQIKMARAASPPTLAKNARMGHPLWECCTQTSLKVATRLSVRFMRLSLSEQQAHSWIALI